MNKARLLIASILIATIIFVAGLFSGWAFDRYRSNILFEETRVNELNTESFVTEQLFLEHFEEESCDILSGRVPEMQENLREVGAKLAKLDRSKSFDINDFNYLKRKYFIQEVQFLSIIMDLNKNCESNYDIILYFYDPYQAKSISQGQILDAVSADRNYELIVLSFDGTYYDEPLLNLLVRKYHISELPTLVINNENLGSGLIGIEKIEEKLDLDVETN